MDGTAEATPRSSTPMADHDRGTAAGVVAVAALALAAAVIEPLRWPILAVVALGSFVLRSRHSTMAPAWAATIPVLATFAWGVTLSPLAEAGPFTCESPLSLPAVARLAEAISGVLLVLAVGRMLSASRAEVGLRWPSRVVTVASLVLVLVVGPVAVIGFRTFAAPFFGAFDYAFALPSVLLPAVLFALANGTLEEIVYRGAMLGWMARVTGWWPAAIAQAVVFGAAHSGPGFVGSALPVVVAMGVAGLLAAVVVRRTGSLLPTIAIHVAVDVPLYLFIACRVP